MALEAIRGALTIAQLAAKHGVHQTMINAWRRRRSILPAGRSAFETRHGPLAYQLGGAGAPVLVVHARDDRLAPVATASFTAARIETAETLIFDKGGHLLLGHHEAVGRRIVAFLASHTDPAWNDPAPPRETAR